jgi:hypothetical protein
VVADLKMDLWTEYLPKDEQDYVSMGLF